jgi:hypothetical protein
MVSRGLSADAGAAPGCREELHAALPICGISTRLGRSAEAGRISFSTKLAAASQARYRILFPMLSFWDWIQGLERRYAWGVFGTLLGIIGLLLALLSFRDARPEIRFETFGESNVLDVHTPVPALDVLYNGESLQRRDLNLRIINVRVVNTGEIDVLPGSFDNQLRWGFRLSAGRIVDLRVTSGSSDYVRRRLAPRQEGEAAVSFNPLIFDRNESVTVQVLVLHRKGQVPLVTPFGKVAGVSQFVNTRFIGTVERNFAAEAFAGPTLIQVARLALYGTSAFALFTALLLGTALLVTLLDSSPRFPGKRSDIGDADKLRRLLFDGVDIDSRHRRILEAVYRGDNAKGLVRLRDLLTPQEQIAAMLARAERAYWHAPLTPLEALLAMRNEGLLIEDRPGEWSVSSSFNSHLAALIEIAKLRSR